MTSLIDRYVAAAADNFPGSDNTSTTSDVRAAVEDLVEAKLAEGLSQEQAERAAIEDLGDPRKLANSFRQEPRYLIGPRLFHSWWKAIRSVVAIVVPVFMVLGALEHFSGDSESSYELVGEVVSGAFEGLIQGAFWVTLIFAIIQLAGGLDVEEEETWSADDLPEIQTGRQITIGNVVVALMPLIGALVMTMRFREDHLGALNLNQLYDLPANTPVFSPELSNWWGIGFVVLLAISLLVSIWSFYRGYWTRDVLAINLLDCAVWFVYLIGLALAGDILNPLVVEASSRSEDWAITGENSSQIIVGILFLIVLWGLYEPIKGHLDYRKQTRLS